MKTKSDFLPKSGDVRLVEKESEYVGLDGLMYSGSLYFRLDSNGKISFDLFVSGDDEFDPGDICVENNICWDMVRYEITPHKGGRDARLPSARIRQKDLAALWEVLKKRGISFADWVIEKIWDDHSSL